MKRSHERGLQNLDDHINDFLTPTAHCSKEKAN